MNPLSEFKREVTITSFFIDSSGNLSFPSLFLLFQDIAWEHAGMQGFGFEQLKSQGLFWVLSRIHVKIDQLPQWGETVTLTTWSSGTDTVFALRDYTIHSLQGEKIISATSSWLIMDYQNRQPQRPDSIDRLVTKEPIKRATEVNAERIRVRQKATPINTYQTTSLFYDIDVNGHINNTRYIEWAINSLPHELLKTLKVKNITINFLAEGFINQLCNISATQTTPNEYVLQVEREEDQKSLCLVRIQF